jgi:glycosyltransferase involved in cell wall biosynthesis
MLSICVMLAKAGYEVRSMCVSAFDSGSGNAEVWHKSLGFKTRITRPGGCKRPVWSFEADAISHNILDTGTFNASEWDKECGADFEKALEATLDEFAADVALTYGGTNFLMRCRKKIHDRGIAVVVGLRNLGHFVPGAMRYAERGLAPSQWLADKYAKFFGQPIDGLPPLLIERDVIPDTRDDVFYTFVNPLPHKGMMFFIRLADELSQKRPDIPLLIVDSAGTCEKMLRAALAHGIDLHRHENIMLAPKVSRPAEYLRVTRAVLVPSLWDEPSGRVAAEAQLCGMPTLVSDRGGLPETVGEAGIVLHIPRNITPTSKDLPPVDATRPWMDTIERLTDDEAFYKKACADAALAGARYKEAVLATRYVSYFDAVKRKRLD